MKTMYEQALDYVDRGLLSMREDDQGHQIFCYTKGCFYGGNWDFVTKKHRGVIYKDGQKINYPFEKIFNVDEVPETNSGLILQRIEEENFEIYDKANGHLFILTCYKSEGEWVIVPSTKGSLAHEENQLLNHDIEIFDNKFRANVLSWLNEFDHINYVTMMFEAINSFDKHTLYDKQVEMYGNDTFVLLSMVYSEDGKDWFESSYDMAYLVSDTLGFPLVRRYSDISEINLEEMKDHKGIEGYVIRFYKDDFRVKIKTKEYWAARFKKELTAEKALNLFASGGKERMQEKLPEEVFDQMFYIVFNSYLNWYRVKKVDVESIKPYIVKAENDKQIFTEFNELTHCQKAYVSDVLNERDPFRKILSSKGIRQEYADYILSSSSFIGFENSFKQIVNEL